MRKVVTVIAALCLGVLVAGGCDAGLGRAWRSHGRRSNRRGGRARHADAVVLVGLKLEAAVSAGRAKDQIPRVELVGGDAMGFGEVVAVIAGLGFGVVVAVGRNSRLRCGGASGGGDRVQSSCDGRGGRDDTAGPAALLIACIGGGA